MYLNATHVFFLASFFVCFIVSAKSLNEFVTHVSFFGFFLFPFLETKRNKHLSCLFFIQFCKLPFYMLCFFIIMVSFDTLDMIFPVWLILWLFIGVVEGKLPSVLRNLKKKISFFYVKGKNKDRKFWILNRLLKKQRKRCWKIRQPGIIKRNSIFFKCFKEFSLKIPLNFV